MKLSFKRIHHDAVLPSYAHPGDAGMDVRSVEDLVIPAGGRALVHTGLVAAIPDGYELQVRSRSGLALKSGVAVLNSPGTVDAGYRGEIGVILANFGDGGFAVKKGDRIAQLVAAPVTVAEISETAEVDVTARGAGGFGSTGRS